MTPEISVNTPLTRLTAQSSSELENGGFEKSEFEESGFETGPVTAPEVQEMRKDQAMQKDTYHARCQDACCYYAAKQQVGIIRAVIAGEERRAKRLRCKPFEREPGGQEQYERRLAEEEQTMAAIRAKYEGLPCIQLFVTLETLGEGLVAAREAAGLAQADLARHLSLAVSDVQRWERNCYADLTLSDLISVLTALGLNASASVLLRNGVPDLRE